MTQYKNQRVGIFVDVQNMYYSGKQLYGAKVNFATILKEASRNRQVIRAIAYVIRADVGEEQHFFDALGKIGYEVRSKDLQIFYGGAKKGDWDVGIAMDIMRLAGKLDTVVLVSGDGDFQDLLEHVKALGCRAEVISFGKTASSKLKAVADHFIDMDQHRNKFLIPQKEPARQEIKQEAAEVSTEKPAVSIAEKPRVLVSRPMSAERPKITIPHPVDAMDAKKKPRKNP